MYFPKAKDRKCLYISIMDRVVIKNYKYLDHVDIWKYVHETMLTTKCLFSTDAHSYTLMDL